MIIKTTIKKYIILAKVISIVSIITLSLYIINDYFKMKQSQITLLETNQQFVNQIESFRNQLDDQSKSISDIREDSLRIERQFSQTRREVANFQRLTRSQIIENQEGLQNQFNVIMNNMVAQIGCVTGDISSCQSKE